MEVEEYGGGIDNDLEERLSFFGTMWLIGGLRQSEKMTATVRLASRSAAKNGQGISVGLQMTSGWKFFFLSMRCDNAFVSPSVDVMMCPSRHFGHMDGAHRPTFFDIYVVKILTC